MKLVKWRQKKKVAWLEKTRYWKSGVSRARPPYKNVEINTICNFGVLDLYPNISIVFMTKVKWSKNEFAATLKFFASGASSDLEKEENTNLIGILKQYSWIE